MLVGVLGGRLRLLPLVGGAWDGRKDGWAVGRVRGAFVEPALRHHRTSYITVTVHSHHPPLRKLRYGARRATRTLRLRPGRMPPGNYPYHYANLHIQSLLNPQVGLDYVCLQAIAVNPHTSQRNPCPNP